MFWRRGRARSQRRQPHGASGTDYGASAERHRLSDGDVVPVAGYRRYADILAAQATEEPALMPINRTTRHEDRPGVRRWLP